LPAISEATVVIWGLCSEPTAESVRGRSRGSKRAREREEEDGEHLRETHRRLAYRPRAHLESAFLELLGVKREEEADENPPDSARTREVTVRCGWANRPGGSVSEPDFIFCVDLIWCMMAVAILPARIYRAPSAAASSAALHSRSS
jgi:hypothetical protein